MELVLRKRALEEETDGVPDRMIESSTLSPRRSDSTSLETGSEHISRVTDKSPDEVASKLQATPNNPEPSLLDSTRPTPIQRPTYVRLPSPKTFAIDDTLQYPPTEPTSSHSQKSTFSDSSSSNLKLFDSNFTRGSPSASYAAVSTDPCLPVLVVDDDPITRTLMKRILTRLGCQVSCAENGEVALEMILGQRIKIEGTPSSDMLGNSGPILEQVLETPLFEEGKYAVVFLDNQMPIMSGLTVVAKLRQLERTDFIVGVTGQ